MERLPKPVHNAIFSGKLLEQFIKLILSLLQRRKVEPTLSLVKKHLSLPFNKNLNTPATKIQTLEIAGSSSHCCTSSFVHFILRFLFRYRVALAVSLSAKVLCLFSVRNRTRARTRNLSTVAPMYPRVSVTGVPVCMRVN